MQSVMILGVGNLLLKDEGIGVHAANILSQMDLPKWVDVKEIGTAVFDILPFIEDVDRLIIIDAIKAGGSPGSIYRLSLRDVNLRKGITSLHQISLIELLSMQKKRPKTLIIGAEPEDCGFGLELSPKLKEVLPNLVREVLKEIGV